MNKEELEYDLDIITWNDEESGVTAYRAEASMHVSQPLFGKQSYFDGAAGVTFRLPVPAFGRFLAIYQHKNWWIRPEFGRSVQEIPGRTQLLILEPEHTAMPYTVYLAVCDNECRSDIAGSDSGIMITTTSNCGNRNRLSQLCVLKAEGLDPYTAIHAAVQTALRLLGREGMQLGAKRYPEMFEYLGWCSWDAFYHKVNAAGIREKMEEFRTKQIPVKWVLIDDGWLDADYERQVLKGPDADREKFPDGLGAFVQELKDSYAVSKVGVWHAVMGYWNGLEPGSEAAEFLKEGSLVLPDGRMIPAADPGKAFVFYDKWHSYLRTKCGIDFVKVDGQSAVSLFYSGLMTYGEASAAIQKGLGASAAVHFDNRLINCMGMAPEDMWNRESSAVSRSSDDFVPEVAHGFREHALQNAYNNLLQGEFFRGDWDMFWSSHVESAQNAILRAVSGGPVYTSDAPGASDAACIRPLILADGRVLRCDGVGITAPGCLFVNPVEEAVPLLIFNRVGEHYVMAALNIHKSESRLQTLLTTKDIPGLAGKEWYVWSHMEGKAAKLGDGCAVDVTLPAYSGELFILLERKGTCQILGLMDKYISPAAVTVIHESEKHVSLLLEQEGPLGVFSEKPFTAVLVNGEKAAAVSRGNDLWEIGCTGEGRLSVELYY